MPTEPSPAADESPERIPRLLSIDDDADVCELVREVAERAGFEPTCTTSFEAFEAAYADDLDVVVVDLLMPQVDGIEVLRFLGDRECHAGIILASGVDARLLQTAHQLAGARGLHVLGSLAKPIDMGALAALLEGLVPRRRDLVVAPQVLCDPEDMRRGLAAGEFVAYFQPKVDVKTSRLVAVEALARWRHVDEGLIPPAAFIPVAEEVGLIDEVTDAIIESAFGQAGTWKAQGLELTTSVNVSARLLTQLELPDKLARIAAKHGLETSELVLEVTESWLMEDVVTALDILTRLRMKGFGLSIDDFGTGYSTMQQLQQVPFSELKLDQSFVRGASADPHARTIVCSSVELGHALHLRVVAEGVESSTEWDLIRQLGCDEAQGHYIARPMTGADLAAWQETWQDEHP